ncbi:MAG: hypothetical protein JNK21_10465 [Rhodospirillaceae bacterium]|nr:hypothetical protein [Rhodospirillaceae bacterium]
MVFRSALIFCCAILVWTPLAVAEALRVSVPAIPETLDPHRAVTSAEQFLARKLFTGLVTADADGAIEPGLAERWTVSPDGLNYRFELRRGLTWSDGKRIDADTITNSLARALDPATAAPFYNLLLPIKNAEPYRLGTLAPNAKLGVAAPDRNTVVITLDRPSHQFLGVLALPVAAPVPLHRIAALKNAWAAKENVIGDGPMVLSHSMNGFVLKPNAANPGPARDEMLLTADQAAADITVGAMPLAGADGPAALYQLAVNVTRAPLDQREIRHALSMVIDREALVAALRLPGLTPAYSFVAAPEAVQAPYARLSASDRHIIAEALLLDLPPLRRRTIKVVMPDLQADKPVHEAVAAALQKAWAPLGFQAEPAVLALRDYEEAILNGDFDVAWPPNWAGVQGPADSMASTLFAFSQAAGPWNAGRYREPAFDQFMLAADADLSPEFRLSQWRSAEALLIEDQPAWPLFFYSTIPSTVHVPGLSGSDAATIRR